MRSIPPVATNDRPATFAHEADAAFFKETALEGDSWFQKAQALRTASLLVYKQWEDTGCDLRGPIGNTDLHEVAIMLAGQSLENLLKGIIVKLDPSTLTSDGIEFGAGKKGHDLPSLAERASVQIEDGEADVLQYATEAALSFGRFPLPKSHRHMISARSKSEPHLRVMLTQTLFERFAERLFRHNWPTVRPRAEAAGPPWSAMTEDSYVAYRLHGRRPE